MTMSSKLSLLFISVCLTLLGDSIHAFSTTAATNACICSNRCTSLFADKKSFASISSDGVVSGAPRSTGSLGRPSKKKKKLNNNQAGGMSKKERQRTANGTIQSDSSGTGSSRVDPADQGIQVVRGNRGSKTVTIVRGMHATPVDEKKKILKLLKSKLGVGGTLVYGVLEIQGESHVDKVVEILQSMGYLKARKIGK